MEQHYRHSSFREKLIEHLFIGELLKLSWMRGDCALEVARPEVDRSGCDLIAEHGQVIRHIQLKASHRGAVARSQNVHLGLATKPAGCVVWIRFDAATLTLGPFLFFGNGPAEPLPLLADFRVARHTKANMAQVKSERPNLRVIPQTAFETLPDIAAVYARLFGPSTAC